LKIRPSQEAINKAFARVYKRTLEIYREKERKENDGENPDRTPKK
jgi:hypothetical protein